MHALPPNGRPSLLESLRRSPLKYVLAWTIFIAAIMAFPYSFSLSNIPQQPTTSGFTSHLVLFIPLGFIAGLYGMNFDPEVSPWNMPELGWYLGYPLALMLMGSTALGLLVYFWRKGWFR